MKTDGLSVVNENSSATLDQSVNSRSAERTEVLELKSVSKESSSGSASA